MAAKKKAGLDKGDIVRVGTEVWYICTKWGDGRTYLATPLSSPHYPERVSLGPPRILAIERYDERYQQGGTEGTEADPLKGSGR